MRRGVQGDEEQEKEGKEKREEPKDKEGRGRREKMSLKNRMEDEGE